MKIICINDKNKPLSIPQKSWIKEKQWYTLEYIAWCKPQKCQGFGLSEIHLNEENTGFAYYKADRFGIRPEDLDEFLQLCKDCTDLDDVNIEELLEATKVELIDE